MTSRNATASLSGILVKSWRHWEESRNERQREPGVLDGAWTIALSREPGVACSAIAHETGQRLGWNTYDHELLEKIAQETGLRTSLLESMDERHGNWLVECMQRFAAVPSAGEGFYVRHLIETMLSLAAHGQCIIVGRGAAQLLPPENTLRVRLVAPLRERISRVSKELGISPDEAARKIEKISRERLHFIKDYFRKDAADPANYDLVLNSARFSTRECAAMIVEGLKLLQARASKREALESAG